MTDTEYTLLAKRINQRLVQALRLGTVNTDGKHFQQELAAIGKNRLPEKLSYLHGKNVDKVLSIANKYKDITKFYGPIQGSVKSELRKRTPLEKKYISLVRKVNSRMREMEREGLGDLGGYQEAIGVLKMMYESLIYQGIPGDSFPVMPEDLPSSANLKEIVNDFVQFVRSPMTTARGRREYIDSVDKAFMDRGESGSDFFSSMATPLMKKDKIVLGYWVSIYGSLTHPWLVSDQIVETVQELNASGQARGGMSTVRQIQRMAEAWRKDTEGHRSWYGYLAAAIAGQLKHFKLSGVKPDKQ